MPAYTPSPAFMRFQEQLERLRKNIQSLSEEQQPSLHLLADQAEAHRHTMEKECLRVRSLVDDMRLREASIKFNLWAMQNAVQKCLPVQESAELG